MSARTEALARRKEELRLLARIERTEFAMHARELRRLRKPASFAMVGARMLRAWRHPAWVTTVGALLAARGIDSERVLRGLRYAGYVFAAWRTWRMLREYTGTAARRGDRQD